MFLKPFTKLLDSLSAKNKSNQEQVQTSLSTNTNEVEQTVSTNAVHNTNLNNSTINSATTFVSTSNNSNSNTNKALQQNLVLNQLTYSHVLSLNASHVLLLKCSDKQYRLIFAQGESGVRVYHTYDHDITFNENTPLEVFKLSHELQQNLHERPLVSLETSPFSKKFDDVEQKGAPICLMQIGFLSIVVFSSGHLEYYQHNPELGLVFDNLQDTPLSSNFISDSPEKNTSQAEVIKQNIDEAKKLAPLGLETNVNEFEFIKIPSLFFQNIKLNCTKNFAQPQYKLLLSELRHSKRADASTRDLGSFDVLPTFPSAKEMFARFEANNDEQIYGVGALAEPYLNFKGLSVELSKQNSFRPFILSSQGYGLLWLNLGAAKFTFADNFTELWPYNANSYAYFIATKPSLKEIHRLYLKTVKSQGLELDLSNIYQQNLNLAQTNSIYPASIEHLLKSQLAQALNLGLCKTWFPVQSLKFNAQGLANYNIANLSVNKLNNNNDNDNEQQDGDSLIKAFTHSFGTEQQLPAYVIAYIRYYQFLALCPQCDEQEFNQGIALSTNLGELAHNILQKYYKLHQLLQPYFAELITDFREQGIPVMRHLAYEFSDDPLAYSVHDGFMLGEHILVYVGINLVENQRTLYLPKLNEGMWQDFLSGESYEGGQFLSLHCPLAKIMIFCRNGFNPLQLKQ